MSSLSNLEKSSKLKNNAKFKVDILTSKQAVHFKTNKKQVLHNKLDELEMKQLTSPNIQIHLAKKDSKMEESVLITKGHLFLGIFTHLRAREQDQTPWKRKTLKNLTS